MTKRKILVTGAAGFIGFHLSRRLLSDGQEVIGLDNLNDYYDVSLKEARLAQLLEMPDFRFRKADVSDRPAVEALFEEEEPKWVVHLAAQAGVRYSLINPYAYIESNIDGFMNMLESARRHPVEHLVYASSSSVYGSNANAPFSIHDNVDHPVSLYAATKKANELMAHVYSHLFRIPTTGLRFFTVYGPWGRPDMALFLFTKSILEGRPIDVYNHGQMKRDFTYVDDIVEGIVRTLNHPAQPSERWDPVSPDPGTSAAPYRVYNIGNQRPVELLAFIEAIESELGRKAEKNFMPIQPGDVPETCADVEALIEDVGYRPDTPVETGIRRFVEWYRDYYGV